jgi:hypothetical protein
MKPIRSLAAFAAAGLIGVAGLIGAVGVATAVAPAAAAAPVHASASSVVEPSHAKAAPAVTNCAYHSGHFVTYYGGCGSWTNWACTTGNAHSMNPPQYVSNACADYVLLYQNSNFTGNTLCIAHDSRTGHLNNSWRSFRVIVGAC